MISAVLDPVEAQKDDVPMVVVVIFVVVALFRLLFPEKLEYHIVHVLFIGGMFTSLLKGFWAPCKAPNICVYNNGAPCKATPTIFQ